jgi:hypothetical protein
MGSAVDLLSCLLYVPFGPLDDNFRHLAGKRDDSVQGYIAARQLDLPSRAAIPDAQFHRSAQRTAFVHIHEAGTDFIVAQVSDQ